MNILDLLRSPWAIQPEKLLEIQAIYATHLRGEKIDIEGIEARLGRPLANDQQEYQVREGGIAVLPIEGVMAPKANLFMRISGGMSTQMMGKQLESAAADPRVKATILAIDSSGGSTIGSPELGAQVRELAAIKPIVTVTDGIMASAAYWVGSAANAVFGSGPTVLVGSIGILATHNYTPNASTAQTTEITAGRYKRMASSLKPLDADGQAYMQQMVDHLYGVFVDTVAENRGTTAQAVLEHMADGRTFVGQQAVDAGLLDGFATVDQIAERLALNPAEFSARRKAQIGASGVKKNPAAQKPAGARASGGTSLNEPVLLTHPSTHKGITSMDLKTMQEQHPELLAQIQKDAASAAQASAFEAGAVAERQRIADVRAQGMPGHEKLIETLAFDGKTTGPEAAMAVLAAERSTREAAAKAFLDDAPKPVATSAAPADVEKTKDQKALEAQAYSKEHGVSITAALKALGYAA